MVKKDINILGVPPAAQGSVSGGLSRMRAGPRLLGRFGLRCAHPLHTSREKISSIADKSLDFSWRIKGCFKEESPRLSSEQMTGRWL